MENFKAKRLENSEDCISLTGFSFPLLQGDSPHGTHDNSGDATACSAEEVHTWLGGVACGLEGGGGAPGDYVSTFTPPEPLFTHQHGIRTRWTGMVTTQYIYSMLKNIRYENFLLLLTFPSKGGRLHRYNRFQEGKMQKRDCRIPGGGG